MNSRCPVERLTPEEAAKVREIIDRNGKKEAALLLGLREMLTLMTAAAGFDVHRLTVITIRSALARRA